MTILCLGGASIYYVTIYTVGASTSILPVACARKNVSVVFVHSSAAARLVDKWHGPTQSRSHLQKYLLTELQDPVLVIARVYGHSFGSSVEAKDVSRFCVRASTTTIFISSHMTVDNKP